MPLYLYQLSYTPESIKAQIADPQDRLKQGALPILEAAGGKMLGGGFSFGEYDVTLLVEAPDDETVAAVAAVVAAGGAVRSAKTTKLLSGDQWISVMRKAQGMAASYRAKK